MVWVGTSTEFLKLLKAIPLNCSEKVDLAIRMIKTISKSDSFYKLDKYEEILKVFPEGSLERLELLKNVLWRSLSLSDKEELKDLVMKIVPKSPEKVELLKKVIRQISSSTDVKNIFEEYPISSPDGFDLIKVLVEERGISAYQQYRELLFDLSEGMPLAVKLSVSTASNKKIDLSERLLALNDIPPRTRGRKKIEEDLMRMVRRL